MFLWDVIKGYFEFVLGWYLNTEGIFSWLMGEWGGLLWLFD